MDHIAFSSRLAMGTPCLGVVNLLLLVGLRKGQM
jgi:hypothetical protein